MRRYLPTILAFVVLLGFLGWAIVFAVSAWRETTATMSIHGWIALTLGCIFSLLIGCGLFALMFYSNRHGYDDAVNPKTPRDPT
jgi:hypothetical protein